MKFFLYAVLGITGFAIVFYLFLHLSSLNKYPVEYGVTFNLEHAQSLDMDWKKTYLTILDELKPKYLRLSATWKEVEWNKDDYGSGDLDWQMEEAAKRGIKVTLVAGQKAPRWPECHVPLWTKDISEKEYKEKLFGYLEYVVTKYKDHPALELWQVENEPFIRFKFGECERFDNSFVPEEVELVRSLDPNHKIMITDSGELSTWRRASKYGDILGSTLYRIVRSPKGKIYTYDWLPASFYRYKAYLWGNKMDNFYIAELQAEPWFMDSTPADTPIEEQEKTMSLERLEKHFDYVERIGTSRAYLWGAEWWVWMKDNYGDMRYVEFVNKKLNPETSSG